jgi:hypothetical protein
VPDGSLRIVDHIRGSCEAALQEFGGGADTEDMEKQLRIIGVLAAVCATTMGCDALSKLTDKNPASPSPSAVSLDVFAGAWASTSATTPATGCGDVHYTVTPTSATTANVTFSATCAESIQVTGSGTGKVNGSTLEWSAQGLVGQGGTNCPFTFPNGKATEEPGSGIRISYAGTVCGIPITGSEVVKRP